MGDRAFGTIAGFNRAFSAIPGHGLLNCSMLGQRLWQVIRGFINNRFGTGPLAIFLGRTRSMEMDQGGICPVEPLQGGARPVEQFQVGARPVESHQVLYLQTRGGILPLELLQCKASGTIRGSG